MESNARRLFGCTRLTWTPNDTTRPLKKNPTSGRKNFKLKADMTITGVKEKSYKGYGVLYKFAIEEEIDHGKSVVARFATYTEADAAFFHEAVAAVLKELHAEAGIVEEEEADEEEEAEAAPAPARSTGALVSLGQPDLCTIDLSVSKSLHIHTAGMWGGMDA